MSSVPRIHLRVARLVRIEGVRLRGRLGPLVALAVPALVTSLASLGYKMVGPGEDPFAIFNAWGCAAKYAGVGLQVGAFVLLIVSSQLVASDASSGVLRTTLCAPVGRSDLFLSKAFTALLWTLAVFAVVWAFALLLGAVFYDFGDVVEIVKYGGAEERLIHREGVEMEGILASVLPLSILPLAACAFLGLACSFLTTRPATALVSALMVYLPLEVFLKHFSDRLSPYLFVTYTDRFTAVLGDFASGLNTAEIVSGEVRLCLLSSSVGAILFLSISFIYFGIRDIKE